MGDGEGRVEAAERPVSKAAARIERVYVLTYTVRWRRWLPIRVRHTYEKVCSWDDAIGMQSQLRAMGATNCEVRRGS